MKMKNPLLVVKDIECSKEFYRKVLGLRTIADLGANAVLTGGLSLQTHGDSVLSVSMIPTTISLRWEKI